MKKRSLFALFLACTLALGLLAGCGGGNAGKNTGGDSAGGGDKTPGASPVELTVVTSYGGDDGNRKNYENAVASYEAASGNKIMDASASSNEEWKAKVLTDFQTGTEPDVLFFFTNADAEPFIQAGKVVDLATIRASYPDYADNIRDSMLAAAQDGKNYAVPSSGFWENMFVNTQVLADCGVDVPGPDYTWDQFLTGCEAIGGISMGYFITKKAWDDPAKQAAAVEFVQHMTSDEVMSTFVTTEVTALKNGASPSGLNPLEQAAADANANITGVIGAVQDAVSSECKADLFANVQNVVTGKMTAEEAVSSAIALN